MISSASKILLGEKSGKAVSRKGYCISVSDAGAIMRIDYNIYMRQVSAEGLSKVTKNIFMYTYVISSADMKQIQVNDLATAVELSFGKTMGKDQRI